MNKTFGILCLTQDGLQTFNKLVSFDIEEGVELQDTPEWKKWLDDAITHLFIFSTKEVYVYEIKRLFDVDLWKHEEEGK